MIEGERLELKKGPFYWLGPDLTLRDCTIVISAARRALSLVSGQFINCTIQAKGQLKTMPWVRAPGDLEHRFRPKVSTDSGAR